MKIAQYAAGQESSATTETLDPVTFRAAWRDSGGPGTDAWSYDSAQTSLYVFFNAEDQDMTVTIDYTVKEAAIAYQDVGEVY